MAETQSTTPDTGPGAKLREAREAHGLSTADISESLKVSRATIEALEAENVSELPEATYVYGYLRSYAKLLDLSADELIEGFPKLRENLQSGAFKPRVTESPIATMANHKPLIAIASVLIFAGSWMIWYFLFSDPIPVQPTVAPQEQIADSTPVEDVTDGSGLSTIPLSSGESPLIQSEPQSQAQPEGTAAPESHPDPGDEAGTQNIADSAAAAAPTENLATLQFEFTGECWVEVKDAGDNVLIYRLGKQGQVRTIRGKPPLMVIIGNAPMVKVTFNGKPVDVIRGRATPYRRLILGRR